nr:MAG TPA: lysozyme [Caudoviricetes sp.]
MRYKKTIATCSIAAIISLVYQFYPNEIRTSKAGLEIIGNAEGCRREPYKCPSDVLTVGIGSTEYSGLPIEPKRIYTDLEIAERWKNDIQVAEKCVNQYGNGRNLPQPVFDAATSITFNVGCGAMRKSTMFKYLNAGKYVQACNELSRWTRAGGRVLPGLVSRREKEKQLCLTQASN